MLPEKCANHLLVGKLRGYLRASVLHDLLALMLCLIAALAAYAKTHDLNWPCENDLYRDLGAAQSILDGGASADPAYAGEWNWYPPLVPAVVATISRIANVELHQAYTTSGIYLNLVSPASFYIMMAGLFHRRAALGGLVGFLFLGQLDLMSWLNATYSPWLWSCNLSQGLFYLALLAVVIAFRNLRPWAAVVAGIAVGLATLSHVAPGLLLGGTVIVGTVRGLLYSQSRARDTIQTLLVATIVAGSAIVVSSPFWFNLVVEYRLQIRNEAPARWLAGELTIEQLGYLSRRALSVRGWGAALGLFSLLWRPEQGMRPPRWAIIAWGSIAALGLGYGYLSQRIALPPIIPSWHFYFYLQALESALFGLGVAALGRLVAWVWTRNRPAIHAGTAQRTCDLLVAALLILVLVRWDKYAERADLVLNRRDSLNYARYPALETYKWALQHTRPSDVMLADADTSFFIAAAGRKVVALPILFSNPYVSLEPREKKASATLNALASGRLGQFRRLQASYDIRYIAISSGARKQMGKLKAFRRVHSSTAEHPNGTDVYFVRP